MQHCAQAWPVEADLGALALPAAQRPEQRLRDGFDGNDHCPRQLHEMSREHDLAKKHRELAQPKALAEWP